MTTPDTQDLIKRLEAAYKSSMPVGDLWNLCQEAADELERQPAEHERRLAIVRQSWERELAAERELHAAELERLRAQVARVVWTDGVGAARSSLESCHDGVSYIEVDGRCYYPLTDAAHADLIAACCGRGKFPPAAPAQQAAAPGFSSGVSAQAPGLAASPPANVESATDKQSLTVGAAAPLEEALKRAYYYDERGEWRGPGVDEWDRWHAVAKVAQAHAESAAQAEPVAADWADVRMELEAAGRDDLSAWVARNLPHPAAAQGIAAVRELLDALDAADEGCADGGLGPGWQNGHGIECGTRLAAARQAARAALAQAQKEQP